MTRTTMAVLMAGACALASACSRSDPAGGGYSCAYMPGSIGGSWTGTGTGTIRDGNAMADADQDTAGTIDGGAGQVSGAIQSSYNGPDFPAGSKVGVLVSFAGGATADAMALRTYQDGTLRESQTGTALTDESTNDATAAERHVSFVSTLAFDRLEIVFSAAAGQTYSVFEFCGDS